MLDHMVTRYSPAGRLGFTFVWVIAFLIYLPRLASYGGPTREIWKQFWMACWAIVPIVVVWPVLVRGDYRWRIVVGVLCILPCIVIYTVFRDHFDW